MHPLDEPLFSSQHAAAKHDYWARWEYLPEDWERFDQLDWGSARRTFWLQIIVLLLIAVVVVSVLLLLFNSTMQGLSPQETSQFARGDTFFIGLALFLIAVLGGSYVFQSGWLPLQEARKRHQARLSGPHRITIGKVSIFSQSLWLAGQHFPLQDISITLTDVKLTFEPLALHLRRKHSRIASRTSRWYDTIRILLPSGHEQEASQLLARFQQETILSLRQKSAPAEPL